MGNKLGTMRQNGRPQGSLTPLLRLHLGCIGNRIGFGIVSIERTYPCQTGCSYEYISQFYLFLTVNPHSRGTPYHLPPIPAQPKGG